MEICEDLRHTRGMKELYAQRKETIERLFGTAKENHGFRYTQMYGKARMEIQKAALPLQNGCLEELIIRMLSEEQRGAVSGLNRMAIR